MTKKRKIAMRNCICFLLFISILLTCTSKYTPKPKGWLRIELPKSEYTILNIDELPYSFCIAKGTNIEMPPADSLKGWINIYYPHLSTKIYCSFQQITPQTLSLHEEECRNLVKHIVKNANEIIEQVYENKKNKVYGTLFFIKGDSASPIQFMLTDSSSNFFRGVLYYQTKTDADSVMPITEHVKGDIIELIQTFNWKK